MADAAPEVTFESQFEEAFASYKTDINAGYVLISAFLVFFMQAGFCMLTAGSVRAKNARGIIMKNLADSCLTAIVYYCVGWGVAGLLETDGNGFIGTTGYALHGLDESALFNWVFQFAFAASTVTIVSGALAERATFFAYLGYAVVLGAFVYPVLTHWIWSPSGWISAFRVVADDGTFKSLVGGSGAYDFAGSGAVHLVGGVAAFVGAWILGPRHGRYDAAGNPVDMPGHSVALAVLGVFILWFGWYGFNPGSALMIMGTSGLVARAAITTTLGGGAGGLASLFTNMAIVYYRRKQVVWDVMITSNGALAGLAAITGGCALVDYWAAIIIGVVGGWSCMFGSWLNAYKLRVDDPVDAVAVHMWAGGWGLVAIGFFARSEFVTQVYGYQPGTEDSVRHHGAFMGGGGRLLGVQLLYIVVIYAWVGGLLGIAFFAMKFAGFLRVSSEVEAEGADTSHYGGSAYYGIVLGQPKPSPNGYPEPTKDGVPFEVPPTAKASEVAALKAKVDELSASLQALLAKPANGHEAV